MSFFNFYAGVGYNITSSKVALKGNYPLYYADTYNTAKILVEDITDPFKYNQNYNEFRVDMAVSFQLTVFKLEASYTFANYKAFSFGVGINF